MPEGDTIYRTAWRLRPVLVGQPLVAAGSSDPLVPAASMVERHVTAIETRGKHLLMHCDDHRTLHSHLGMKGSWHVYQVDERWQKPRSRATLWLQTADAVAVCFTPQTLELLTATALRRHAQLRRLGPDLLGLPPIPLEVIGRFRVHDPTPMGVALMNQSIVCGIGNVYKSETLFLCRQDPFAAVHQFSDEAIVQLVERASRLMKANLQGYPRRTRYGPDGQKLWVYGRSGEPCLVCGQTIRMQRQGEQARTTYWCPECQTK